VLYTAIPLEPTNLHKYRYVQDAASSANVSRYIMYNVH